MPPEVKRTVARGAIPAQRAYVPSTLVDFIVVDPDQMQATQAAYGYLPVATLKRISHVTGAWYAMIYGTATYYAHLRFEPPTASDQAAAVEANRPAEATYLAALGAALEGGGRPGAPARA